ncbi:hypothetical protein RN001_002328 [Aquatica leii]|uniref:Phospholipid scramblase n=1 Tax=Aquatica leii TaxID=1421715 RepID=A0AAN7Q8K1_9COLE|nr:hypothetical protein RN001_002328 [Aquatica leii]
MASNKQMSAPYPMYPPQQNYAITNQPQMGMMSAPQHTSNCPPGLEYLSMVDQLLVHQKVELLEVIIGFETQNKYSIKNSLGQKVYYAGENSDCCTRNCCGPLRSFEMRIFDNHKNHVMSFQRPFACATCWFPCCLQSMEISAPPGNVIGIVEQKWSIFIPVFTVKNSSGNVLFRIEGPFCTLSCCCGDVEFNIFTADGKNKIGKITKQWTGLIKEAFTDTDNFGVSFPIDLDVRAKATLLGALFLIDFMFFETTREKGDKRPGMF